MATYAENVASSGGELGANGPLVDSPALNAATGNGSSVRAGRSNPRLVGGQAARELDPDGWRAAWLLLGEGTAVVAVGSSGYLEYSLGLRELARRAARAAADAIDGARRSRPAGDDRSRLGLRGAVLLAPSRSLGRVPGPHHGRVPGRPPLGHQRPGPRRAGRSGEGTQGRDLPRPRDLARGLGVTDAPRRLLVRAGATLVEPHTTGARAGDDGAYPGYPFPEIAARASAARAEELELTGAEVIVTASPWALANLRAATSLPVVDICTLVAGTGLAAEDGLAAEERPLRHG